MRKVIVTKKKKGKVHHGDLPNAARAACLRLVEKTGSAHVTLREVASLVGATHVALYRHFASKQALLASVAAEGFGLLHEEIKAAVASTPDPLEQLHRIGVTYVRFARANTPYFRLMYAREVSRAEHPGLRQAAASAFRSLLEVVRSCRQQGLIVRGGSLEVALTAWSLVHGLATLIAERQLEDTAVDLDQLVDVATTTLRAGLVAP